MPNHNTSAILPPQAGAVLEAFRKHSPDVLRAVETAIAATDYNKTPPVIAEAEFAKARGRAPQREVAK